MSRSRTAAITAMLLVTSSAWAASPESQAIRPTGDNQPDESPSERAEERRSDQADERRNGQQGERLKKEPHGSERQGQDNRKGSGDVERSSGQGSGESGKLTE